MIFDLAGRVAVVTGAGQGVGAGIARMLAAQGAAVAVNDLMAERAQATVEAITATGAKAIVAAFDVTDYDTVTAAIADVERQLGPVDILVNNAGNGGAERMRPTQFRETEPAEWRGAIDVNLYGVMNCCRAVINGMCERQHGRIITISSGAGSVGLNIGVSAYGGGKGGGQGFMRHLAVENGRAGVTANSVALGLMHFEGERTVTAGLERTIPVGRLGQPDDVGAICVYLASAEAAWITGQTIHVNGGNVTT